jgi:hypothetical protein
MSGWVDAYISKKARDGSGDRVPDGSLKKWKSQSERTSAMVFHHTEVGPQLFWSHQFPRKVSYKDKDTGEQVTNYWGRAHVCSEDEDYLFQQYRWANGEPKVRPKRCPLCKLTVWLRQQVEAENIGWLDPVFQFEGLTLVAAGLFGYLNKKLTPEEIAEMRANKLTQKESWKQSAVAKAQWLFTVVDNEKPEDGLQVLTESNLLGEKMQEVLRDTQESLGVEGGDYCAHPYAIEWVNDPTQKSFSDRYKARRIERVKLSPEVEELIRGDVPKERIAKALEKPDYGALRDFMEEYCVLEGVPFDDIFSGADAEPEYAQPPKDAPAAKAKQAPKVETKAAPVPKAAPAKRTKKEEPPPPPESGTLPCDKCGAPMRDTDTECAKCGTKYELTTDGDTEF